MNDTYLPSLSTITGMWAFVRSRREDQVNEPAIGSSQFVNAQEIAIVRAEGVGRDEGCERSGNTSGASRVQEQGSAIAA